MRFRIRRTRTTYVTPLRISYATKSHAEMIVLELEDGDDRGRGEALGLFYFGETPESMEAQLLGIAGEIRRGLTREDLPRLLPPGGARNALDCALWDLECKREGRRIWEVVGLPEPAPLRTAFTISLDTPEAMARSAAAARRTLLKLKLGGDGDLERVAAVRQSRPDVDLIVDANQGWRPEQLEPLSEGLAELGVQLIEQPLPAGADEALRGFESPVPICADESCQTTESLPDLVGKYSFVNIKLDKTGGLTEALRLADAAVAAGFNLMVGCMSGSSLSMAPGFVLGQRCRFVDLDGPLLAADDVPDAIRYDGSVMHPPSAALWG